MNVALLFTAAITVFLFAGLHVASGIFYTAYLADALYMGALPSMIANITWSTMNDFILVSIPLFILLGELLSRSGVAELMYRSLSVWLRWLPGGLLHTNILASALFAATSGSTVATAATIGTIAQPTLAKLGYNERMVLGFDRLGRNTRHPDPAEHQYDCLWSAHQRFHRQAVRGRHHSRHCTGADDVGDHRGRVVDLGGPSPRRWSASAADAAYQDAAGPCTGILHLHPDHGRHLHGPCDAHRSRRHRHCWGYRHRGGERHAVDPHAARVRSCRRCERQRWSCWC